MGLPGVENVPTPLESLFKLSRGPQRPYIKKKQNMLKLLKLINFELTQIN